jgi:hypothetical protein
VLWGTGISKPVKRNSSFLAARFWKCGVIVIIGTIFLFFPAHFSTVLGFVGIDFSPQAIELSVRF